MEDRLLKSIIPLQPANREQKTSDGSTSGKKKSTKQRAVQTLFRTLSQNNYRLQEMIDRKAHILISVNAIVLSVLLGSSYLNTVTVMTSSTSVVTLLVTCTLSVLASLVAIKPGLATHSTSATTLLSFEGAKHMDFDTFRKAVKKTIKKENRIYDTMIADIYHVSQNISRKHTFLKISAALFGVGMVAAVVLGLVNHLGAI